MPLNGNTLQEKSSCQTVRWYLKYALSYKNLEEIMAERGIDVDHTTIMRWVHQYSPEMEKKNQKAFKTNKRFVES